MRWLALAGAVVLAAFSVGYILAMFVLFPIPDEGEAGIPMPRLVGEPLEEARSALESNNLAVGEVMRIPAGEGEAATVVSQDPLAGQQIRAGAAVQLAVRSEAPEVTIPDLRGFTAGQAQRLLDELGFDVEQRRERAGAPAGRVIEVRPAPGRREVLPARVVLVVSTGVPTAPDPDSVEAAVDGATAAPVDASGEVDGVDVVPFDGDTATG